MFKASQEFFLGFAIPRAYGRTLITLIPKKDCPKSFDDYMPISLSTFMSKVNTKILACREVRLSCAYYSGPVQEPLGSNSTKAANLLMANLRGSTLSVLINGQPAAYFPMTRGVKQGDPLSPLLFIIASEGLSRLLNRSMEESHIHHYNMGSVKFPGHLTYTDDIMIFTKGDSINLLKLKKLLDEYSSDSGQVINLAKSKFYVKDTTTGSQLKNMEKILAMHKGTLPFTYLGATNCKGQLKKHHCGNLLDHFDKHIHSWYSKTLNQMGRIILIKHVLSSIPLHILAMHSLPVFVINLLHARMANFFWGRRHDNQLHHWKSWKRLCQPSTACGLGIKDLQTLQQAQSINLWWRMKHDTGVWANTMRAIYMRKGTIKEKLTDSSTWKRICRVHSYAVTHITDSVQPPLWDGKPFSSKSTLTSLYDGIPSRLSCKYIWHKAQTPKIQIFQWKAFMNCLPFLELTKCFGSSFPSQCPLCKQAKDSLDHTLGNCKFGYQVWKYFGTLIEAPLTTANLKLNQIFISWWFSGDTFSFKGVLRIILPGVIAWHL
ncbi:unnamed protein product [Cuscuta campestris]|uniref:Reverse transcriptase domain-containing protein n=1 Tax=Cuscuta campestris TaxID=132261 RepID=A0A484LUH2_9ASTE|nr:unnamed protein product [Cuscuta campestris]